VCVGVLNLHQLDFNPKDYALTFIYSSQHRAAINFVCVFYCQATFYDINSTAAAVAVLCVQTTCV
jgi:hypothetical protein